jgi:hypothetical protein
MKIARNGSSRLEWPCLEQHVRPIDGDGFNARASFSRSDEPTGAENAITGCSKVDDRDRALT